jgi:hypothetical protein
VIVRLVLAGAGELSWLEMIFPKLLFLISRDFLGSCGLSQAGFLLARSVADIRAMQE